MTLLNETEVATRTDEEVRRPALFAGIIGSLAGGVVMGAMATMMMPTIITEYIPGLLALEGLIAGWLVHLIVSATFGVGYTTLATETDFVSRSPSVIWDGVLGVGYGVGLWIIAMAIVMPVWLDLVGGVVTLSFPWIEPMALVAHLVYGLVLGAVFTFVEFESVAELE